MEILQTHLPIEDLSKMTLADLLYKKIGTKTHWPKKETVSVIIVLPFKEKEAISKSKKLSFKKLDFYGLWADYDEMKDSVSWVRHLRSGRTQRLYAA